MNDRRKKQTGFTLLEILIATTITAFVAVIAVSTLRAITVGKEKMEDHIEAAAQLRYVADTIKRDLTHLARDPDRKNVLLVGSLMSLEGREVSGLRLYTISSVKARPEGIEADLYEVEYTLREQDGKIALMRRWCPNPHKQNDTEAQGVLMALSESVVGFEVSFFDGQDWLREWPEERVSLPQMVEVVLTVQLAQEEKIVKNSFLVDFPRWPRKTNNETR